MKVKLIYRNYKPLHKIYESLIECPPANVEYLVSDPINFLNKFYPLTKTLRHFVLTRYIINIVEKIFFLRNSFTEDVDILHFINLMDENIPNKPYIVDLEHAASLTGFTNDKRLLEKAYNFLENKNCKSINCMSNASKRSLEKLLGQRYSNVSSKVTVLYPASKSIKVKVKSDFKYIKKSKKLKILFVGNQAYLKGLEELVVATEMVSKKFGAESLELFVVSNDATLIIDKYKLSNVHVFEPKFSRNEIITQFFFPSDIFVMPTKEDTFGMAIIDALVTGTPVITTRQFAIPELINNGVDGILIELTRPLLDAVKIPSKKDMKEINRSNLDKKMCNQLSEVLINIINDTTIIKKMKNKGKNKFLDDNIFSIKTRNQKLEEIYKKSLNCSK